jgi:hypothetical protein
VRKRRVKAQRSENTDKGKLEEIKKSEKKKEIEKEEAEKGRKQ